MARKRLIIIAVTVICVIILAIFIINHVLIEDWRYGDGICEVHGTRMRTVIVRNMEGPSPYFSDEYFEARERIFPNHGIDYPPERYGKKLGKIYVCDQCEKAYEEWCKERGKSSQ